MNRKKGFTIVEFMMVLLVLSILSTLTYQMVNSLWRNQLISISNMDLNNYLILSREKASSGSTCILIVMHEEKKVGLKKLEEGKNQFEAAQDNAYLLEGDWAMEPIPLPKDFVALYSLSGLELNGPYSYILFYPDGYSDSVIWKFDESGLYLSSLPNNNIVLEEEFFNKFFDPLF